MRTLHKIYLFVILISILLYNLYSISKKNKEGFFFGYSPIFDWNRPLELPKEEDEQRKKDRWAANNQGSEMSYEEYMRKKEEEEDNEEECKELMKEFEGVCEDRDNSNNLLDKCPDECEMRKLEWDYIKKTDTMKQAAIKDEEDKEKQQQVIDAKKNLKDALKKRLLPTNLSDTKLISDDFNEIRDFSKFFDYTGGEITGTPEGCKKALMLEKSRYMVTDDNGKCYVVNPEYNNEPKYKLFKKNATPTTNKIWEYVNDYTYDNTGKDLKNGQYIGHMNTTLEECKKLGIGNKSKYIAWTGNESYEPGYCKVLIKKYNKNPDLTTNITPDANFNLFKFTGKYEKKPSEELYNSLLKPMTGKPIVYGHKLLIARRKYDENMKNEIEYKDLSGNLTESQKMSLAYKKIFDKTYQIKSPTLTLVDIQKEGENENGKYKEYRIEIMADSKHEMNRIKALVQPDKYDYFGNIKEDYGKESFQVNRKKEGFITREGHKNCGKNHKEKFMNISRSKEIFDVIHTLTELDKIDMDK